MRHDFVALPVPPGLCLKAALAAAWVFAMPLTGQAQDAAVHQEELQALLAARGEADLISFYTPRHGRPIWFGPDGTIQPAAAELMQLLSTADYDGIDQQAEGRGLAAALAGLDRNASIQARMQVELMLSRAFAGYVMAMRQAGHAPMLYEDGALRPAVPTVEAVLQQAANAPSLLDHVRDMGWMHPLYAELRTAALKDVGADAATRRLVIANLDRMRAIPARPATRHLIVDAANARLWMYDGARAVDSMRVVVGKPDEPTPAMSGYIRAAILNPYWNVPPDLVRDRIAPGYLRRGTAYFEGAGYEVLSDWTEEARPVDPASVDWQAVAEGRIIPRVRQLPGAGNAMGKVKFEFGDDLGIFLHDTPERGLMRKDSRQLSAGCIRLEDADRLGRWLAGAALPARTKAPEHKVPLPMAVPIYITYLTAQARGGRIVLGPDPYRLDHAASRAASPEGVVSAAR